MKFSIQAIFRSISLSISALFLLFLCHNVLAFCLPVPVAFSLVAVCKDGKCEKLSYSDYFSDDFNNQFSSWQKTSIFFNQDNEVDRKLLDIQLQKLSNEVKNNNGIYTFTGLHDRSIATYTESLVVPGATTTKKIADNTDAATIDQLQKNMQYSNVTAYLLYSIKVLSTLDNALFFQSQSTFYSSPDPRSFIMFSFLDGIISLIILFALPYALILRRQAIKKLSPGAALQARAGRLRRYAIEIPALIIAYFIVITLLGIITSSYSNIFPDIDGSSTLLLRSFIFLVAKLTIIFSQYLVMKNIYRKILNAGISKDYAYYECFTALLLAWILIIWVPFLYGIYKLGGWPTVVGIC